MGNRRRTGDAPPALRGEARAHAHNERHRIHGELHALTEAVDHGLDPVDIEEPSTRWRPRGHRDPKAAPSKARRKRFRNWKSEVWKRRKAARRARAAAERLLADEV